MPLLQYEFVDSNPHCQAFELLKDGSIFYHQIGECVILMDSQWLQPLYLIFSIHSTSGRMQISMKQQLDQIVAHGVAQHVYYFYLFNIYG